MTIDRYRTGRRMSQAVVHNAVVYTAGQVAVDAPGETVEIQTRNVLGRLDELLAEVGTDKTRLLSATIWLADMTDFEAMNAVWDDWVAEDHAPARACVESRLATPDFAVEIGVIAAL